VGLEESQYSDVQRCMGLLAFPADCDITPYKVHTRHCSPAILNPRPTQPGHPSAGRQNEYWR